MKNCFNSFTWFLKKNGIYQNRNDLLIKLENIYQKKSLNETIYQILIKQDPRSNIIYIIFDLM